MNPIDRMMSWAQILLSTIFLVFVATVFIVYETGHAHFATAEELKIFERLLEWLTGAALVILYFWFQRQRQGGIPDSSAATVTQTLTAPDGSKASVTSPAHLPLPQIANPIQPATPAKS